MTSVRNNLFNAKDGLDRGRSKYVEALWYLTKMIFFLSAWPWPSSLRSNLLRLFGADVGSGVVIKPRVNILFPWKLTIGNYSWIGEEALLLNFERLSIGSHCCISQRTFICCGNHDYKSIDMKYKNSPIIIHDGAWIGAQSFIAPGVTIHKDAVVTAMSLVSQNLDPEYIYSGNPCKSIKKRWQQTDEST